MSGAEALDEDGVPYFGIFALAIRKENKIVIKEKRRKYNGFLRFLFWLGKKYKCIGKMQLTAKIRQVTLSNLYFFARLG